MFSTPWCLIAQHGVEGGDHLAHAGGERHLVALTYGSRYFTDGLIFVLVFLIGDLLYLPRRVKGDSSTSIEVSSSGLCRRTDNHNQINAPWNEISVRDREIKEGH
jgi:hypothetical protein